MTSVAASPSGDRRWFTVQCGYASPHACTTVVEATSVDEACTRAIEAANNSPGWEPLDGCGNTYVDAIAEGQHVNVWTGPAPKVDVPAQFAEFGEAIALRAVLSRLIEWADHLGGWDAPCWAEARSLVASSSQHEP